MTRTPFSTRRFGQPLKADDIVPGLHYVVFNHEFGYVIHCGVILTPIFDNYSYDRRKTDKMIITNDKGRLSKEDIERMLAEAEKYKEEDEAEAGRISAKNGLESYAYSLKNTLADSKVDEKLDAADKEALKAEIDKTVAWLDESQQATKEEYEEHQKELEAVANPIMMKCKFSRSP